MKTWNSRLWTPDYCRILLANLLLLTAGNAMGSTCLLYTSHGRNTGRVRDGIVGDGRLFVYDLHRFQIFVNPGPLAAFVAYKFHGKFDVRKVNGEIVGCLADKWEISGDGLDYTFHLREGATFSTGDPITSEDIKFSMEFIRDECSQWAWVHEDLESVEIVDEQTAIAHYSIPDASRISSMRCV